MCKFHWKEVNKFSISDAMFLVLLHSKQREHSEKTFNLFSYFLFLPLPSSLALSLISSLIFLLIFQYCCCCCQYPANLGTTENGTDNTDGNKNANNQWDIYLDSQYDTLLGSLVIASEESDTCLEYIQRSLQILSISSR